MASIIESPPRNLMSVIALMDSELGLEAYYYPPKYVPFGPPENFAIVSPPHIGGGEAPTRKPSPPQLGIKLARVSPCISCIRELAAQIRRRGYFREQTPCQP